MARRKALIIGINYTGSSHALNGCVNDAKNIQRYLIEERGFSDSQNDMVMMTDEAQNLGTPFEPTVANVLEAMRWLVTGNEGGESLWLSYSGHGSMLFPGEGE
jgi:uncharacterized caspase-like protein